MFLDIDVRAILPTINVPTLVLHRRGDRVVNWRAGRELASQIPNARYVELPGIDHLPWAGDPGPVLGEVEEFLTGTRSLPETDRVLATVMFTDLVGSTERAAAVGDARWRDLLAEHQVSVRRELAHFRGHEVKTLGDGFPATFDGPARAIRCAHAIATDGRSLGLEVRSDCTPARSSWSVRTSAGLPSTSPPGLRISRRPARFWSRARPKSW